MFVLHVQVPHLPEPASGLQPATGPGRRLLHGGQVPAQRQLRAGARVPQGRGVDGRGTPTQPQPAHGHHLHRRGHAALPAERQLSAHYAHRPRAHWRHR